MTSARSPILLAAFMNAGPQGTAGWRHPDAAPDFLSADYYRRIARQLEEACFDLAFIPDALAVPRSLGGTFAPAVRWGAGTPRLDPMTVLGVMAGVTRHIGLAATVSTGYNEPYNLARSFATFDHMTNGRAGWNVVTSFQDAEARNFGQERLPPRNERYARAEEVLTAATRLWDSWGDDALILDRESGRFGDVEQVSAVEYRGDHVAVDGPLGVPRCPQGYPVIIQAGSSPAGRDFAARWADVVFCSHESFESAVDFYADMKARVARHGRDPDQLKILPATTPVVGATYEEALAKHHAFEALVVPEAGLSRLAYHVNVDLTQYDLDGPLPTLDEVGVEGHYREVVEFARRENLTVRDIGRWYGARTEGEMIGTPTQIVDRMEAWIAGGAADGFMIQPTHLPGAFDDFIGMVLPELRARGLFKSAYAEGTLRDALGLERPERGAWRMRARMTDGVEA